MCRVRFRGILSGVLALFVTVYIKPLSAFSQNTDEHDAPAGDHHGEDDEEDEEDHDDKDEDDEEDDDEDKVVVFVTVYIKPMSDSPRKTATAGKREMILSFFNLNV